MVIKTNLLHTGWSYGNGDDQYENESIGSTMNAVELKKLMENSERKDQNDQGEIMCSNHSSVHTDEQGWTKIEANRSRKPKSENSKRSTIDSIISSINLDFKIATNGASEVKIDSPVRENRCTISDKGANPQPTDYKLQIHHHKKQTLVPPSVETSEVEPPAQISASESANKKRYAKEEKQVSVSAVPRSNMAKDKEKKNTTGSSTVDKRTTATDIKERHGETGITKTAINGPSEVNQIETNNGTNKDNNNSGKQNTGNNNESDKNSNGTNNNGDKSNNNNNNGSRNKSRVNIVLPGDMDTYAFTVSWRPDTKIGQDGKLIIKMLMREMVHRTPSIIFHPTNSATSPVPKDIYNINNDFPTTPASYDDFFDVMGNRDNTNQRTFMKVTMPHDEKELQRKLSNYLFHNKMYMNSPFIDDNTLEHIGFIENGHSRIVYRPNIEMKIRKGLKEVMEGNQLTPQQTAQLKHLSSPIRVECQRGTVRAGPNHQQIVCEGIVLKTVKSQSKIAMELLSMLPEKLLGEHYRIIPKSLGNLLGYDLYGRIVADTVDFQNKLRPITILHCHPSVFEDMYDPIKRENSTHVEVHRFIIENCGAISIEETNETKEKGKYIVIVPEEKVDSARTAIGKMFQEFQECGGRPAAMACLTAYQNFPLVNDNVTISGHAQRLSEKIRSRYQNRPKTPMKSHNSSASYSYHGSTAAMQEQSQQIPAVPRSIVKQSKHSTSTPVQQWQNSPRVQQHRPATTNHHHTEERTILSNLSPDDSAKTMMTNVSRMVDTLGSAVNTLARESANTNDTMKQMMIQQTTTMNNLMLIMARNEEQRRQEIPTNIIQQQTSTPSNSTMTNSQYSLSQHSTNANKRKITIADDETTAVSTVLNGHEQMIEDDDIDAMLEDRESAIEELEKEETKQQNINNNSNSNNDSSTDDVTMTDQIETNQQQQKDITNSTNTASMAAGDFNHQFNTNKNTETNNDTKNAPYTGVNQQ